MTRSALRTKLVLRIKRRKTVSVTPAMGARMVAGSTRKFAIWRHCGTRAPLNTVMGWAGFSQNLCMPSVTQYLVFSTQSEGQTLLPGVSHIGMFAGQLLSTNY